MRNGREFDGIRGTAADEMMKVFTRYIFFRDEPRKDVI